MRKDEQGAVEVRRAGDRLGTHGDGVESRHSFSFGAHYDPGNVGDALLVWHNDDTVHRSTITGRFVKESMAQRHPSTTISQRV